LYGWIGGEDYAIGVVAEAVADSCTVGGYRLSCGAEAVKLNWQRAKERKESRKNPIEGF